MPPSPTVPSALRRYFWDYGSAPPSLERDGHTVVLRLLQVGGLDAVRWLRAHVGDDLIREVLARRQGRGVSPRRLRFWALVLDLPREEVDGWIGAGREAPWERRVHG